MSDAPRFSRLTFEKTDHLVAIGLNRPAKRNAFDTAMLRELAEAYTLIEEDDDAWCGLLFAHGGHFTAGLDLSEVGPAVAEHGRLWPETEVDPLGLGARVRSKPMVVACQGWCLTIGTELALACDVVVAADDTKFGQIEVKRGIYPFGGATLRLPKVAGWHNAMRYLLTGDIFDAAEARRIGLVAEVTSPDTVLQCATELAKKIVAVAPLAVQASIQSARAGLLDEPTEAQRLIERAQVLMKTEDAAEGLASFVERREAKFSGR